ncbi:VanW family protein [Bacillus luteolus]|uniref:VanW family protein n=1 Tax=Litchfieldia luteola TaxID=682179 RepID=A0ABR9QMT3_9BACI|nr:VanW family protein [Cytobacillus luteolus]MBE4909759.1 VanW family protein [Cytobacillus luteolus]MBP1942699.1 vancomycin resistance protein VanW [Cytobacillus luteolus]
MTSLQPIKRGKLRIYLGKKYYRMKRYAQWYTGDKKYALKKESSRLPNIIFTHNTLLLRQLKDVDMWLQHNKIKNLAIAIKQLNTIVIKPGETFSYWRLIGNTTKRKGYVDGMILHYGKVTTGVGGGLCQLSNLIYWMTLHTPLTVTERYRHSYDVFPDSKRSQPFGSGATCAFNYLDLQIKNETNQSYQLIVYLTHTHLVGEWRAEYPKTRTYEVYEKEHSITAEYWGGYVRQNTIYRKVYNIEKELIDDEFIAENRAIMMYEPFLEDKQSTGTK